MSYLEKTVWTAMVLFVGAWGCLPALTGWL
jgi:hypothetical protein